MKNIKIISFSQSKWDQLSEKAKFDKLLIAFQQIEAYLMSNKKLLNNQLQISRIDFFDEIKSSLLVLKDDTIPIFNELFISISSTKTVEDVYLVLREFLNNMIIKQKDFHFMSDINIVKGDKESDSPRIPLILILDNLRSAFNTSSIIRTAECLNIEEILFCGYTPTPDNDKVKNTAMGTHKKIRWQYFATTTMAINYAKQKGYLVYALETVEQASSVYQTKFINLSALLVGNEALGISEDTITQCDTVIKIPLLGWKNSLNVATATAVCCFEIYRQLSQLGE